MSHDKTFALFDILYSFHEFILKENISKLLFLPSFIYVHVNILDKRNCHILSNFYLIFANL